jgi:hypothetical protein
MQASPPPLTADNRKADATIQVFSVCSAYKRQLQRPTQGIVVTVWAVGRRVVSGGPVTL